MVGKGVLVCYMTTSSRKWSISITTMTKNVKSKNQAIVAHSFQAHGLLREWVYLGRKKTHWGSHGLIHGWDCRRVGLLTEFYGMARQLSYVTSEKAYREEKIKEFHFHTPPAELSDCIWENQLFYLCFLSSLSLSLSLSFSCTLSLSLSLFSLSLFSLSLLCSLSLQTAVLVVKTEKETERQVVQTENNVNVPSQRRR